jgi:predicted ester cyclase
MPFATTSPTDADCIQGRFQQRDRRTLADAQQLLLRLVGAQLTIDDTVAEGDRLALRFHVAGEHKGDFMGVPATGRRFVLNGQTIMSFRDGRVIERWTTGDLLGLLTQLGAIPAPGN